jgi:sugar transferase (PEP-CTERM/EpsH1 system associated)
MSPRMPGSRRGVEAVGLMAATDPERPSIVQVIPTLRVGGLEKVVVRLTEYFAPRMRQTIVAPAQSGPLSPLFPAEVSVVAMADQRRPDRWNALRMVRLFRALQPDIVHTRNWTCIDAIVGARLAGVPIVIHGEHGREATDPEGRNAGRRRLRRLLAPFVTEFVTVSQDLARWLVEEVRIPARKVRTIYNGVDTREFSPEGRARARQALGLPERSVAFGTVGRLDPVKDHVGLLRALAQMSADPEALLYIVGDGPCRSQIEAAVRALGLSQRVRLLGDRPDVPEILPGFDVFVLPSLGEGMSNAILEAMAAGLPVVATRVGGNPELVLHEVSGLLVEPRSSESLMAGLSRYAQDPCLRAIHGRAARERAESEFGLRRMLGAYDDLYSRHLAARRSR